MASYASSFWVPTHPPTHPPTQSKQQQQQLASPTHSQEWLMKRLMLPVSVASTTWVRLMANK
jgi:hypothetical protein